MIRTRRIEDKRAWYHVTSPLRRDRLPYKPFGATMAFTYGELGNMTSATGPFGGQIEFSYDDSGSLTRQVSAAGRETTLSYRADGRLSFFRPTPRSSTRMSWRGARQKHGGQGGHANGRDDAFGRLTGKRSYKNGPPSGRAFSANRHVATSAYEAYSL